MPSAKEQTAYVLPEGFASSSSEPQVFQGFPGRWSVGEPVAVADLGLTDEAAAQLVEELGLPHKKTKALAKGYVGDAELRSDSPADERGNRSPVAGLTQEEFEDRVEEETKAGQLSPVIEAAVAAEPTMELPKTEQKWPTAHADLDALAAEHNYTFADDVKTTADKTKALEAAGFEPPIMIVSGDGS